MPTFDIETQWVAHCTPRRRTIIFDEVHRHRCTFTIEDNRQRITITRVLPERPTAETILGLVKDRLPADYGRICFIYWRQEERYFIPCRVCDEWFESRNHRSLCSSCEETYTLCHHCGNFYLNDELQYDEAGDGLCEDCRSEGDVGICEGCRYWQHDLDEDDLCEECARRRGDGAIHEHGYQPCLTFLPTYGARANYPQVLYMGVELETDYYPDWTNKGHCVKELNKLGDNETLFHLQSDGSLDNGFEVVSQPATLDYHKTQFPWGQIITIVKEAGGKSHDTTTCGLHIHFNSAFLGEPRDSDENDLNATKLTFLFEKFWEQLKQFSRRKDDELRDWARRYEGLEVYDEGTGRYTRTAVDDMGSKDVEIIKKAKDRGYGRYLAVNFENHDTVEVRIFKGTLRLKTLYATLEFVDFLVRFVKQHSAMYLRKLDWAGLIAEVLKRKEYQYLPNYMEECGLCAK